MVSNTCWAASRTFEITMTSSRWNDRLCSKCGALAHCRTDMYMQDRAPAPGLEYLCKTCMKSTPLPPRTALIVVSCAEPNCKHMAGGWFQLWPSLRSGDEIPEVHYLCAEHAWRWRKSLGPEWDMLYQSLSPNGDEHFDEPRPFQRDDLAGAFWGDESDKVN